MKLIYFNKSIYRANYCLFAVFILFFNVFSIENAQDKTKPIQSQTIIKVTEKPKPNKYSQNMQKARGLTSGSNEFESKSASDFIADTSKNFKTAPQDSLALGFSGRVGIPSGKTSGVFWKPVKNDSSVFYQIPGRQGIQRELKGVEAKDLNYYARLFGVSPQRLAQEMATAGMVSGLKMKTDTIESRHFLGDTSTIHFLKKTFSNPVKK